MRLLQYMLSVLSSFIPEIPPVTVDGVYGNATRAAVLAAQRRFQLPETGSVDTATWDFIYDQYSGIENTALRSVETFPSGNTAQTASVRTVGNFRRNGNSTVNGQSARYARTATLKQFPGNDLTVGAQDPIRQEVVR